MGGEPAAPRPRLLYLVTSFNPGGAEWGLVTLVRGGVFAGFDLTVAALVRGVGAQVEALKDLGHPPLILWDRPRLTPVGLAASAIRLRRLLTRLQPAGLVLSLPHANLLGRWLRPKRARPMVLSFEHNSRLAKRIYEVGYRVSSSRVDWMLADCRSTADAAAARLYRRPPRRVEVAPLVEFSPERLAERPRHAGTGKPLHIVSAARLTPAKDQARLIALIAALGLRGLDVRLTLFGEGPLRSELEAEARRKGVADRVRLAGHTAQWWLTPADLFLLTSRHEGLCIAALEAMAAGLPVAAPAVGGMTDYGPAAQALVLDGGDLKTDADRLAALLRDQPRLNAMALAGRAMVGQRYASAPVRAAYAELNAKLLAALARRMD